MSEFLVQLAGWVVAVGLVVVVGLWWRATAGR